MASAQVVETSVNNNSPSQDSNQPDDLFRSKVTPFVMLYWVNIKFLPKWLRVPMHPTLTSPGVLFLYYYKANPVLGQIPVLWLVLSWSGFCGTNPFHGNGPARVFLFWSEATKKCEYRHSSQRNYQKPKRLKFFRNFKDGWRRRAFSKLFFINFVQFWINFHSFTWHWLDPYFVTKKILFDRQETLCRILESTTAFVRFRYKALLFKLILDDFTLNKFVFRTRGSLFLSELFASSELSLTKL